MLRISVIILFSLLAFSQGRKPLDSKRFELLSGGANTSGKNIWDKKYSKRSYIYGKAPEKFLAENYDYIPQNAKVLDVGIGEGRHAVFLAQKGYDVLGIDISSVALKKSKQLAREYKVRIDTILGSFKSYKFKEGQFDAIINFYWVDHSINNKLKKFLKPGGVLIYEAYTTNQLKKKGFEKHNPEHMLSPGELLKLFPDMQILKYEEPMHEDKYRASIILQKVE